MSAYAPAGLLGLAVPQANPTAEAELRLLLPPGVGLMVTRLTSAAPTPASRLIEYADRLPEALTTFDPTPLAAVGLACSATSYLLGAAREAVLLRAAADRAGYPVLSATVAVADALEALRATRLLLLTAYPEELNVAAQRYWQERGATVVGLRRVAIDTEDTRGIYRLPVDAATAALTRLNLADAQAVIISGTGMPSLSAIRDARLPVPVLSSNLALAWALLRQLGVPAPAGPESPLLGGWSARLQEVLR